VFAIHPFAALIAAQVSRSLILCLVRSHAAQSDYRSFFFRHDADRKLFLELLAKTCRRTGWQIHAYCLMGAQKEVRAKY